MMILLKAMAILMERKTEMWYVMDNPDEAIIYSGWNRKMTKAEIINKTKDGTIAECLNAEKSRKKAICFLFPQEEYTQ